MTLVESIACEARHILKQRRCIRLGHAALHRAAHKHLPFRLHDGGFFLRHGTAYDVRLAEAIARNLAEDFHDLFLIHNTAVGFAENFFKYRRFVHGFVPAMPPLNILRNRIHRTRTIQRNCRSHIVNRIRAQAHQHLLHALGFQLKHAISPAIRDERIGLFVVIRNLLNVKVRHAGAHHPLGIGDNRQIPQPEKVKLDKSEFRNRVHVKLRHNRVAID